MKLKKLVKLMPDAKVKYIDNEDYCTTTLKNISHIKMELLERKVRSIVARLDTIYIYLEN